MYLFLTDIVTHLFAIYPPVLYKGCLGVLYVAFILRVSVLVLFIVLFCKCGLVRT